MPRGPIDSGLGVRIQVCATPLRAHDCQHWMVRHRLPWNAAAFPRGRASTPALAASTARPLDLPLLHPHITPSAEAPLAPPYPHRPHLLCVCVFPALERQQGGRVYDSKYGVTCHWCRQKTLEEHVSVAQTARQLPPTRQQGQVLAAPSVPPARLPHPTPTPTPPSSSCLQVTCTHPNCGDGRRLAVSFWCVPVPLPACLSACLQRVACLCAGSQEESSCACLPVPRPACLPACSHPPPKKARRTLVGAPFPLVSSSPPQQAVPEGPPRGGRLAPPATVVLPCRSPPTHHHLPF